MKKNRLKVAVYSIFLKYSHNLRSDCCKNIKKYVLNSFKILGNTHFIPQGITTYKDKILVSLYDPKKEENSRIYVLNNHGVLEHICSLNTKAHVGGIGIFKDILWATDKSGSMSSYKADEVLSKDEVEPIINRIKVEDELRNVYGNHAIAYLNIYKNKMFIGNYNTKEDSYIKIIDIKEDGSLNTDNIKTIKSSDFIQGISVFDLNDKTYLMISSSFMFNASTIKIYEYKEDMEDLSNLPYKEIKCPKMLEQIAFTQEKKLLTLYEAGAKKYHIPFTNVKDIIELDIENLVNKLK